MNEFLINIGIGVFILFAYIIFKRRNPDPEFEKLYHEVLTSEKYKVKDQYERTL